MERKIIKESSLNNKEFSKEKINRDKINRNKKDEIKKLLQTYINNLKQDVR